VLLLIAGPARQTWLLINAYAIDVLGKMFAAEARRTASIVCAPRRLIAAGFHPARKLA
jgi:hypothetical protein